MNYGNNLKMIRTSELWSQEKVATSLGIKRSTYKEYELQNKIIPLTHLNNFCNIFDVSIDYIFNLSNTKNYKNSNKDINIELSAKRLKQLRIDNNLTLAKLTNSLNIAIGIFCEYEKGHYLISTHTLYTICKKYNISADYLLGKTDSPKYLK